MKIRILLISAGATFLIILTSFFIWAKIECDNSLNALKETLSVYSRFYGGGELNDEAAAELKNKFEIHSVTLLNFDGTVVGDSSSNSAGADLSADAEVKEAMESGSGFRVRKTDSGRIAYYCHKTEGGALILLGAAAPRYGDALSQIAPDAAWIALIDLIICVVFTYFASKLMLKPVKTLADDFTKKNGARVETVYRELKPIADALNVKNKEIDKQLALIEEENRLVKEAQDSKNEFISNITHEMNTPLTSIIGFAQLLDEGNLDETMRKRAVSAIITQSERLSNLIRCIINYNEINSDELPSYEVDVSQIATETVEELMPSITDAGLTIQTNIEENVTVPSRYERVREILGNLIRNATKYNKPNGKIIVTVKGGNRAYMQVEDTGIGIAAENLDKIFSRFFTVDKSHNGKNGGFGLGLAVVKRLCKKAGWKLTVESVEGEGTKFRIEF